MIWSLKNNILYQDFVYTGLRNPGPVNWSKVVIAITQDATFFHENDQPICHVQWCPTKSEVKVRKLNLIKPGIKHVNIIYNYLRLMHMKSFH